jgi:hypothetical protein
VNRIVIGTQLAVLLSIGMTGCNAVDPAEDEIAPDIADEPEQTGASASPVSRWLRDFPCRFVRPGFRGQGQRITIDAIEPTAPVENRPMRVRFTLCNTDRTPTNGYVGASTVQADGFGWESSEYWSIPNLAACSCAQGVITLPAPSSALDNLVRASYFAGFQGEFGRSPDIVTATSSVDTAARYVFTLRGFTVQAVRSAISDTNWATLSSPMITSEPHNCDDGQGNRAEIGDVSAGESRVLDMKLPPVDLLPDAGQFVFNYTIVNAGDFGKGKTVEQVLNVASKIAALALTLVYPQAAGLWAGVDAITGRINHEITQNCDGVVVAYNVAISPTQLLIDTSAKDSAGKYIDRLARGAAHPGTWSPWVCGSERSHYTTTWLEERRRYNDDTLDVYPHLARIRLNESVQFSTNLAVPVHWSVEGGIRNGSITEGGSFRPSSDLPKDGYVTVIASTGDGKQAAQAYVALQP